MSRKISKKSDSEWASLLGSALTSGNSPQGEGWQRFSELREQHGISERKMRKAIRELIVQGKLDVFHGSEPLGKRAVNRVWYRIAKHGKE